MPYWWYVTVLLTYKISHVLAATDLTNAAIHIVETSETFYSIYSPQFLPTLPDKGSSLEVSLILAKPLDACTPLNLTKPSRPTAVVALRGACTYQTKVKNGEGLGAIAIIIVDTVIAHYNTTAPQGPYMQHPCDVDCRLSEEILSHKPSLVDIKTGFPNSSCATSSKCSTGLCGAITRITPNKLCCLPDMDLTMQTVDGLPITAIPAMFLGASRGVKLTALLRENKEISGQLYMRSDPFPWAFVQIWFLGVFTVSMASYFGVRGDRSKLQPVPCDKRGVKPTPTVDSTPKQNHTTEEPMEITVPKAIAFLVLACAFLVGIYFLIKLAARYVVLVFNVLFAISGGGSLVQLVVQPLMIKYPILPSCINNKTPLWTHKWVDGPTPFDAICYSVGFGLSAFWFLTRHATYAFILQNIFSIVLICQFLAFLRIPNLRIGALLLSLFLLYDVFMVFISPYVFHTSVMYDVATAGKGSATQSSSNAAVCVRTEDEQMPMLLILPRTDRLGGFAMLGLGDVILPGLLLVLALRWDYTNILHNGSKRAYYIWHDNVLKRIVDCVRNPIQTVQLFPYYTVAVIGYAVGLCLAFLAILFNITINNVQGQPALLYLVPCTLIGVCVTLAVRGELCTLWKGPVEWKKSRPSANGGDTEGDEQGSDEEQGVTTNEMVEMEMVSARSATSQYSTHSQPKVGEDIPFLQGGSTNEA